MIQIQANLLNGLEWRQPGAFSRTYELKSGDSVLAELAFQKVFGTLARAWTADAAWTFKRAGFLTPVVTVRVEASEADIATYQPNWTGNKGLLNLPGGEQLEFRTTNFWASEWVLSNQQGGELIRFHNKGLVHHGASVEVSEAGKARADIALLMAVCWYVLVLHMQDSAAVAAT
jgi:hypothetical protein